MPKVNFNFKQQRPSDVVNDIISSPDYTKAEKEFYDPFSDYNKYQRNKYLFEEIKKPESSESSSEQEIPATLSVDPQENPFLSPYTVPIQQEVKNLTPEERKEVEETNQINNILTRKGTLKDSDYSTLYTYEKALKTGKEGASAEDLKKLIFLFDKKRDLESQMLERRTKKTDFYTTVDPTLLFKLFSSTSDYKEKGEALKVEYNKTQKEIEKLNKPALEYQKELNAQAKKSYFEVNPEIAEVVDKMGSNLFRFAATAFNVSNAASKVLLPILPGGQLPAAAMMLSGSNKATEDLQVKLQTAKMLVKNDNYLSYALGEDKNPLFDFIQGTYYGGNNLLTLGFDNMITDTKAAELRNKSPEFYTNDEKEFLKAYSQEKEIQSLGLMEDDWAYGLGEGLVSNLGFIIPFGASAKTVSSVGARLSKFAFSKAGRTTAGFWNKALDALKNVGIKGVETVTGTVLQPMSYEAALRKYTENIEVVKDENGNDRFLIDEKTKKAYEKESRQDIRILENEIKTLNQELFSTSSSDTKTIENLTTKIKEKETAINIIQETLGRIITKEGEVKEDASVGKSLLYGLMQSGREYFTETIGGDLITRFGKSVMRTTPLRGINTGIRTLDANINNLLVGATKGKGMGKLFDSASKHTGVNKIWHGLPTEWAEEILNQFIPVIDENWIENIKQVGNPSFHRDIIAQTLLLGSTFAAGSKLAQKNNYLSLSREDREKFKAGLKQEKEYKKDFKRNIQGFLLDINSAIKSKEEADLINMASFKAFFNEKDVIEQISSLRSQGLNRKADYLETKNILKIGMEAFEQGRLESFLTPLRKVLDYKQEQKNGKNPHLKNIVTSLEQLQRTASKYENKVNFSEIIDTASKKFSSQTTLEEIRSQIQEIINNNFEEFSNFSSVLEEDSHLKDYNPNNILMGDENSFSFIEKLAENKIGEANRLLDLSLLQQEITEDLVKANKDFNYETNPYYYKEILERTERKELRDSVKRSKSPQEARELKEKLMKENKLTPEANVILTVQESGSQPIEEELNKIESPSVVETAKIERSSKVKEDSTITMISEPDLFGFPLEEDDEGFMTFKDDYNLFSMKIEDEDKQKEIKEKLINSIQAHSAVIKREAVKNPLIHEKDFDFRRFMLDLYNGPYKKVSKLLIENFDLFVEAWKESKINQQSEGSYELVFEELISEIDGDILITLSNKIQEEEKKAEKVEEIQEEIQEKDTELKENVVEQESEVFMETKEVRRAYKIPFLGQFYNTIIDKIKGIVTKQDTDILNEEAFFFLNYKNLPIDKKVKIKLSEDWRNPNKIISNWETVTAENGIMMSIRKDITMKEFVEDLFDNKHNFEKIINNSELLEKLFNNELFISKVPIDLISDEQRLPDKGLHDIYWWNYDTIPNNEDRLISSAIREAKALNKTLSDEDIDLIKAEARAEQEAKISIVREKLFNLRETLLKSKNSILEMRVSKREVGHILENPIKIRDNREVIVKDKNGRDIKLKEVKSIADSNPDAILAVYRNGKIESKEGSKTFYIPLEQIENFSELQSQMTENYQSSFGEGTNLMIYQVGTKEVFNKEINRNEVVPQFMTSLVYSNTIEAQPFLNELLDTLKIVQRAVKEDTIFKEGVSNKLVNELNEKYNINLRDSKQLSEFINLFPETVRKPIIEDSQGKRGEPVKAWMKDGIIVEKGTPGAYEIDNKNSLRYDINLKSSRDSMVPNIEFIKDEEGKIIDYRIKEEIPYGQVLKRGIYTTNRFLKIQEETGEIVYVADSQPIIILSPLEEIKEIEVKAPIISISTDKKVEKTREINQEKVEVARKKVTDTHKGAIVSSLTQEVFIDLKPKVNNPLKLSMIYSQMNKTFDRKIKEMEEMFPEEAQVLKESRDIILGYSQYEDSVREQVDLYFNKTQEYSNKVLNNIETDEDLGEEIQQTDETPEEFQESDKEDIEGIRKDHSKHSFEQNLSLALRARTNILLSGIENPQKNIFPYGNLKHYHSLGTIISGLQEAFESAEDNSLPSLLNSINHIINTTGGDQSDYNFLTEIYKILTDPSAPIELVKEIQFLLYQNQVKMIMAFMKTSKNETVVTAMDADNKNKDIIRRNIWNNNFKQSSKLINNSGYTYTINKEEADRLINLYNTWKEDINYIPTREAFNEFLLSFGINLHSKTIDDLFKGDRNLSYQKLISSNGLIGVLIKNLKDLKNNNILEFEAPKEKEHLLFRNNNSNIKRLLSFDNKNVFIPASSIYVGGKIVNKFEQPCFITEQLKKISNLDKETIDNLLSCPYTKNSFILKYLMETEGKDKTIEVSTISLESFKKRGEKSSDKTGITDLSPKDFDITTIGLFAHQGPKIEDRFGTTFNFRTAYLPFPPISDASRLPLLKTIVVDLNKSNFILLPNTDKLIPTRDILQLLYNQLVIPEFNRISEYLRVGKEIGKAGYDFGANKFSMLPSLNGLIIGEKTLLQALHEDLRNTEESSEIILTKYKESILEEIREVLENTTEQYAKYNIETKNIEGSFVDNGIYLVGEKRTTIENIDNKYLDSKEEKDPIKNIQILAYDYVVNYMLNQAQIQMLISGDMANYYDDKKRNVFADIDGTIFKTDTKEFMLEMANLHFSGDIKLPVLIHNYFSTENVEKKEEIYKEIAENYNIKESYNPVLNPTLKDHNSVAKKLYRNFIRETVSTNYFKRLKGILSPGSRLANSKGRKTRQLCIKDVKISSEILKNLIETYYPGEYEDVQRDVIEFKELDNLGEKGEKQTRYDELHNKLKKKFPLIQDYLSITSTDAQELTTWKEFLEEIRDKGKISTEMHKVLENKLTKQSEEGYTPAKEYELTQEEMKIVFQPSKPLHAGLYFENHNGHKMQSFVYIKSSAFPLLPSMTRNFPHLENLRKNMEKIEKIDGNNVRLSYQSANKVGSVRKAKSITSLYKKNLNDVEIQGILESSLLLDKDNYSIQQEKPSDFEEQVEQNKEVLNTRGTQFEKILLSNGLNKIKEKIFPNLFDEKVLEEAEVEIEKQISGEDLYKILNTLYRKEQDLLKRQLLSSLGLEGLTPSSNNIRFYEAIAEKIKSQLSNYQDREGLELVYYVREDNAYVGYTKDQINRFNLAPEYIDFKFPLWMLPNSRKFESVLNSIINKNSINMKIPGFHTILGSQEGFEKISEEDFNKMYGNLSEIEGMYFNPSYSGKLKATRDEEGNLLGSQVLISNKFSYVKDGKRYKVNLKEYLKKDEKGSNTNQLDLERLPQELLSSFSFRIPTSSHQSGCLIEIAGFLPDNYGDLMIVPADYTVQIGEDYDIDARNIYGLHLVETERDEVKYLEKESYERIQKLDLKGEQLNNIELLAIQNNISNLYKSVYSTTSKDVLRKVREKLSTDTVRDTAELIYEETRKDNFTSIYNPAYQREMLRSGATGKLGIAIHSNFLTLTGLFQQMNHEVSLINTAYKDDEKITIPFKMTFGKNFITDGSLQREKSVGEERTIASYHMENQNTSTDNQKLLYMFKRNENKHTINVLALMTLLGLNKDNGLIDGKSLSYSSLFISQPIIRRYCELMDYYTSINTEIFEKPEDLTEKQLVKEFGQGLPWKRTKYGPVVGILDTDTKNLKAEEMTSENLFDNLSVIKDNILQWTVYEHFKQLKGKIKYLSAIQKFLNIENKGMGISYFNTIALKDFLSGQLDSLGEAVNIETIDAFHIRGVKEMIGDFKRIPKGERVSKDYIYISSDNNTSLFIKPTTYFGHKIVNSISLGYNMWKVFLPYENPYISNIINTIREDSGIIEETEKDLELKYTVINELKNFSYTANNSLFGDDLEKTRRELFIDDKENISLAGYLNYLQKINHPIMQLPFFRQLEMRVGGIDLPSVIIYNATSLSKFEKNEIRKVFKNLLNNENTLPSDEKGKSYTFELLGKKLLQYAMLSDQENGAVGFRHMFPLSFFDKYYVTKSAKIIGNVDNVSYHNIFFNGPVKSLELLLGSNIKDGFIRNNTNTAFNRMSQYIERINKIVGKEIAFFEVDGVRILEGETDFIHSRFSSQFLQHNPQYAFKMKKEFSTDLKKMFGTDSVKTIKEFNVGKIGLDTRAKFIYIKEKNIYYLFQSTNNGNYKRIPLLGLFGVNEYNYRISEIDKSIVNENNLPKVFSKEKLVATKPIDEPEKIFTIDTLLETISSNNDKYGGLAKIFSKFADKNVKVEVIKDLTLNGIKAFGVYTPSINTIRIDKDLVDRDPNLEGDNVKHILEEYIHSLTTKELSKYLTFDLKEVNSEIKLNVNIHENAPTSVARLARVYQEAFKELLKDKNSNQFIIDFNNKKKELKKEGKSVKVSSEDLEAYRISDINEFIAGIFFDDNFRKLVGNKPYMSSGQTLIQAWAETFIKFLQQIYSGFHENTIGRESIEALYQFLTEVKEKPKDNFTKVEEPTLFEIPEDKVEEIKKMEEELKDLEETESTFTSQNYYEGDIKPEPNTVFVFGSNPEGRHGAGAAKIALKEFGAKYGQGEGLQGNAYALPTKRIKSLTPAASGNMAFDYNGNQREDIKSKSTIEAIINGERTATTRYDSDGHIDYWKNLKIGDIIEFKRGNTKVYVKVTKPLTRLDSNANAETWSKKEGWSVDYFNSKVKPRLNESWQIEYEFVDTNGEKTITNNQIVESIKKLYDTARANPTKQFKIAYRNTDEASLNGYTGLEMIEMFNKAGEIPPNIIFSKEWFDTGKLNQPTEEVSEQEETKEEKPLLSQKITKDNGETVYQTLFKDGKIENQGFTITLEEFENMTQEEQDNFIKCL